MYNVSIKKKVLKKLNKLPVWVQKKDGYFGLGSERYRPRAAKLQNFSQLSSMKYHCHLGTSWAACWEHDSNTINIEVYYVGSREKAPY